MKKSIVFGGIVVALLAGAYLFLSFYAVKFVQARLQKSVGPGLTIAGFTVHPTYLGAKGIRYEDPLSKKRMAQIEEVRIYPGILSLFRGNLEVRKLTILNPYLNVYRSRNGALAAPWVGEESKQKERASRESEPLRIEIGQMRVTGGVVEFEDRIGETPARIELRELDLEMKEIRYPLVPTRSPIRLEGKIRGGERKGKISMSGWIDLKTMNLEISFKVEELDIKSFEPYYRRRVSAEIETGCLDMDCRIVVKERVIDAPGQMVLKELRIKEGGTVFWIPAKTVVSLLKDRGGRIPIQFHLKGNVDDPKFKIQEAFLTRIAFSFAEALGIPVRTVGEGVVKGAGEGVGGLAEGFRSLEGLFKKKKEGKVERVE
jgi:hypothetical protein